MPHRKSKNYVIHQNEIKCKLIEFHGVSILMDTGDTFYGDSFQDRACCPTPLGRARVGLRLGNDESKLPAAVTQLT